MNIKAILFGSAALVMTAGAAAAADLPVAEPVDYVKVCDAYGAGYFFLPGTDTCLKIHGYVRAEARYSSHESTGADTGVAVRGKDKTSIWARGQVNFTAREETELGTLSSRIRFEGNSDSGVQVKKAWTSLGGFYAGLITSNSLVDYVGDMYGGDFDLGDTDVGSIGYNFELGNGVSAHMAIENNKHLTGPAGTLYAGQSLPTFAGRLKVKQGWGEVAVGGVVTQTSFRNAAIDEEIAYTVAAGGKFNLDMLSAGSNFAVNGFYSKGAFAWVGISNGDLMGDVSSNGELNEAYGISASLKYAFADNFWAVASAGYAEFEDQGVTNYDYDLVQGNFEVGYKPVNNLKVVAGVSYTTTDFDDVAVRDSDEWAGKIRIQRDF